MVAANLLFLPNSTKPNLYLYIILLPQNRATLYWYTITIPSSIFFGFLSRVQNIVGVTFYFWLFLYHLKLSLLKYTLRKSYYCTGSHKQTYYCTKDFPNDAPDLNGKQVILYYKVQYPLQSTILFHIHQKVIVVVPLVLVRKEGSRVSFHCVSEIGIVQYCVVDGYLTFY